MRSLIFAGIQRYSLFSPNHVGNDAAIFSAVAQYLKAVSYTHLTLPTKRIV